jgi:hypothetical protein
MNKIKYSIELLGRNNTERNMLALEDEPFLYNPLENYCSSDGVCLTNEKGRTIFITIREARATQEECSLEKYSIDKKDLVSALPLGSYLELDGKSSDIFFNY